jgi:long-subunit acyl-CoA synthetase (AMP-forming)
LSLSPMPWIMEHIWGVGIALCGGMITNFPERPETVLKDFIDLCPTVVTGSADFWEDLSSQIIQAIDRSGKWHRLLFDRTLETATLIATLESEKKPRPWGLKIKNELLQKTSYPGPFSAGSVAVRFAPLIRVVTPSARISYTFSGILD